MRELALVGAIASLFGLGSFWATGSFGPFNAVNLGLGALALLAALGLSARRLRGLGGAQAWPVLARGAGLVLATLALAVAAEWGVRRQGWRFDWTLERSFELSEAMQRRLAELPGPVTAHLFVDPFDPRKRRTRLLLETLARHGPLQVVEHELGAAPELEDRFAIPDSNSVALELNGRAETVDRPTEGPLYEALSRLDQTGAGTLVVLAGAGEGDPTAGGSLGFSGLGVALQNEGYAVRSVVSAALREVPRDTSAVLAIAPRRRLPESALAAVAAYLETGGSLVAFLEPGHASGLVQLLAGYGLRSPDHLVVDPASAPLEEGADGLGVLAFHFESHPVTRGLGPNRMVFFPGARSFTLRKPRREDDLERLVLASPRSWLSDDLSLLGRSRPRPARQGAREDYHSIAVAGSYARDGRTARIVAFGDSDFASNRWLRTLYNADLVLNAVHWAVQRESEIKLLPKLRSTVQFPLPVQNTLRTFYGIGLLVPELLLLAGGLVWLRRLGS